MKTLHGVLFITRPHDLQVAWLLPVLRQAPQSIVASCISLWMSKANIRWDRKDPQARGLVVVSYQQPTARETYCSTLHVHLCKGIHCWAVGLLRECGAQVRTLIGRSKPLLEACCGKTLSDCASCP